MKKGTKSALIGAAVVVVGVAAWKGFALYQANHEVALTSYLAPEPVSEPVKLDGKTYYPTIQFEWVYKSNGKGKTVANGLIQKSKSGVDKQIVMYTPNGRLKDKLMIRSTFIKAGEDSSISAAVFYQSKIQKLKQALRILQPAEGKYNKAIMNKQVTVHHLKKADLPTLTQELEKASQARAQKLSSGLTNKKDLSLLDSQNNLAISLELGKDKAGNVWLSTATDETVGWRIDAAAVAMIYGKK